MAEPFFWEERGAWYVNLTKSNGKRGQVKLHAVKKKAFAIWKEMDPHLSATDPLVASVADDWIGASRRVFGPIRTSPSYLLRR